MQEYQINIKTKKMISQRKILLITRHGECPKAPDGVNSLDELLPESFSESYKTGAFLRNFVDQENVTPLDTFLKHSGKKRTKYTGEAILTGAFGMKTEPTKPEDLEPYRQRLASQGLDTEQLPMLDFEDIKFSINGFKRDGENGYISKWIANPMATQYDNGEEITSFQECLEIRSECLAKILEQFLKGNKKLGVIASHCCSIDAIVVGALNSGRVTPIRSTKEYGQSFKQGDFATILLDPTDQGYKTTLVRNGQPYETNLHNMLKYPGKSTLDLPPK